MRFLFTCEVNCTNIEEESLEVISEKSEKIIAFHVHLSKDMFTR